LGMAEPSCAAGAANCTDVLAAEITSELESTSSVEVTPTSSEKERDARLGSSSVRVAPELGTATAIVGAASGTTVRMTVA
jgi:hypothetical protein